MTCTNPVTGRHPGILSAGILTLLALGTSLAVADDEISRKEFLEMKKELKELRQEVKALRAAKSPAANSTTSTSDTPHGSLQRSLTELSETVDGLRLGESKFTVVGNAEATFTSARNASSNFSAAFEPMFLFRINDHLLFEGEIELELEGNETTTNLEFAQLDWMLNDNLTLVAGKFLNPMNNYVERYAPTWIRKLPDNPLGLYDGFLPESNVGVQLRGVYPIGSTHLNFQAYVSNAPRLITDDPEALGMLDFDNFESQSDGKAYGGRIGFMPCSNFEVGYGAQYARVRGDGTRSTHSLLQSVDLSTHLDAAKGRFTLLGQYSWSNTGDFVYDEDGSLGVGPINFSNHRNGGYVQVSYRGKQWDNDWMNKLEFIVRGDMSNAPNAAPGSFDEKRLTLGIDYWLAPATMVKAAYEIDQRNNGEPNADAILLQLSTGF